MQTLVIGIDSLDPYLLERFADDLPNLDRLRRESPSIKLTSIFPPDSIPAWISIFTGLNPAEHGIVYVFDIFKSQWQDILDMDTSLFQNKTFWDRASDAGKKVCVLFPTGAFPPWPVNGIMVSRSTDYATVDGGQDWEVEREIHTYPTEARSQYSIPTRMRGVSGSPPPQNQLLTYAGLLHDTLTQEADLCLRLFQASDWDLGFITFAWLDIIQHLFWRYMDESDPTHPGPTPYRDVIYDTYQLLDRIIGQFMQAHPKATLIVLSDHGHGIRPPRTVNINEFLRERGYLTSKGHSLNPIPWATERLKNWGLNIVHKFNLDHLLLHLSKQKMLSSISKSVYMSSASIDFKKSQAHLSSFAGPKSYRHGGIEINKEVLGDGNYEALRAAIIEELTQLLHPETGEALVSWVCKREDLYTGSHISTCYPDIVFELREGYGTYWGIHSDLIGVSHEHNLSSGGHAKNAVFLIFRAGERRAWPVKREMYLMDVAPLILNVLDWEELA
jgi:predicted AlkP superfamily phosphohydrolase/phosphomutase